VFKLGLSDLGVKLGANFTLEDIQYDDTKYRPYDVDIRQNHNNWLLSDNLTQYSYWNSLDIPYNPSKGVLVTNKFTLSGLTPTVEAQHYLREDAKIEAFLTLFSIPVLDAWNFKMVLGAHSSFTGLFPKPGVPMQVKTGSYPAVDGMMVMRGWSDLVDYDATSIWYNWVELRMPIVEQVLWLDFFVDAAVVATEEGILQPISGGANIEDGGFFSMNADNIAISMGAMLRLTIQQLPIKLGLAKKFTISQGSLTPVKGEVFYDENQPMSGFNFVISLSQSL
jgi:outer membrane protein insertion porin family